MNSAPYLKAVIEVEHYPEFSEFPWPIAEFDKYSFIHLSEQTSDREIGLIIAQLIMYNEIEIKDNIYDCLQEFVVHKSVENEDFLIIAGGLQICSQDGKVINPGCCCGLEGWREWADFLKTKRSPWMGHSPSPWVEKIGNIVRIWSDGGISAGKNAFCINFEIQDFVIALNQVYQDLNAFLLRLELWAKRLDFPNSDRLVVKFDRCFSISPPLF
jgi:hypothetical protein